MNLYSVKKERSKKITLYIHCIINVIHVQLHKVLVLHSQQIDESVCTLQYIKFQNASKGTWDISKG